MERSHPRQADECKGLKGVSRSKDGRFIARITFEKVQFFLGSFDTPEAAHSAYKLAEVIGPDLFIEQKCKSGLCRVGRPRRGIRPKDEAVIEYIRDHSLEPA